MDKNMEVCDDKKKYWLRIVSDVLIVADMVFSTVGMFFKNTNSKLGDMFFSIGGCLLLFSVIVIIYIRLYSLVPNSDNKN